MNLILLMTIVIGVILITLTITVLFFRAPPDKVPTASSLPFNEKKKPVAVVFGGTKGVGLEITEELLAQNYMVIVATRSYANWYRAYQKIMKDKARPRILGQRKRKKDARTAGSILIPRPGSHVEDAAGEIGDVMVMNLDEEEFENKELEEDAWESPDIAWIKCDAQIDTDVEKALLQVQNKYGSCTQVVHACLCKGNQNILVTPYRADHRDGRYNLAYSGINLKRFNGSADESYPFYANLVKTLNIIRQAHYFNIDCVQIPSSLYTDRSAVKEALNSHSRFQLYDASSSSQSQIAI